MKKRSSAPAVIISVIFILCLLSSTGRAADEAAVAGYDDLGREVVLSKIPERIIVLTGTLIDAIFELGAGDKIVGVVDNIDLSYPGVCRKYPELLQTARAGRFNAPNLEKIAELDPDLIIPYGSVEAPGTYTAIFEQRQLPYATFSTVKSVAFGLDQLERLGVLLGKKKEAEVLSERIRTEIRLASESVLSNIEDRPRVFFWWGKDNATYGKKAVIQELIELAGGTSITREFDQQYMEISPEYVISQDPEVVIISYWQEKQRTERVKAFKEKPGYASLSAVKNNRVFAIDGHGIHSPILFRETISELARYFHPELF